MEFDKLDLVKQAAGWIVAAGTAKIVNGIIENNVDIEKRRDKVTIKASSLVIGGMAKDATSAYTDAKIDAAVVQYHKLKAFIDNL